MILGLTMTETRRLDQMEKLVKTFEQMGLRLTLRIIADPYESGFHWEQLVEPVRRLYRHCDLMLCLVDSMYVLRTSHAEFRERARSAIEKLGDRLWAIEYANEYGGRWTWEASWMRSGPEAEAARRDCWEKHLDAQHTILELSPKMKTVVTFYLDAHFPGETLSMAREYPLKADLVLVSYYPMYTPGFNPSFNDFFNALLRFSQSGEIGWGEFGPEPVKMKPAAKSYLIQAMMNEELKIEGGKFIGGGFYWDAFSDLLAKPSLPVRNSLIGGFKKWSQ